MSPTYQTIMFDMIPGPGRDWWSTFPVRAPVPAGERARVDLWQACLFWPATCVGCG